MIRSIKELRHAMDARAKSDEIERDEEGRAIIEMTVLRDEDFLSDFSAGARPVIGAEVAEYLNESALPLLPKEPVCLKIYSDCISEEEQSVYNAALMEYYARHYKENRIALKRNAAVSVVMAVVGLVALAVTLFVSFFWKLPVLSEALDIFAWVFIWEAVDLFFLERAVLRMRRNSCLRFLDAKIVYLSRAKTA